MTRHVLVLGVVVIRVARHLIPQHHVNWLVIRCWIVLHLLLCFASPRSVNRPILLNARLIVIVLIVVAQHLRVRDALALIISIGH